MNHLTPDKLTDFVHGELTPASDALVHAHLAACASCRAQYDLEIGLSEALRTAAKAEELDFPTVVKAVVWERIRELPPSPADRLQSWFRPLIAVPVAAVLVVGAFFASPYGPRGAGATIDAGYYLQAHAAESSGPLHSEPAGFQTLETSMTEGSVSVPVTLAEAVNAVR